MLAVAGGKGGSGKTTTTLGLARALSRRGARVVAADADWDLPNLARLAAETATGSARIETGNRADPERGRAGKPGAETVRDAVSEPETIGLDPSEPTVLAAPDEPRSVDASAALAALDGEIPDDVPVLLDCPAGASPDAAAPLRAADRALIATPLRRAALRDAAKTAAIARRLDCSPVGTVVIGETSAPAPVATLLGCPVLGTIPDGGEAPLSDSAVRAAYDDLARRLGETAAAAGWRVA